MRVSLQWLRELVSVATRSVLVPEPLAERLSIAGFEVEGIEDLAARAAGWWWATWSGASPIPTPTS